MNKPGSFKRVFEWKPFVKMIALAAVGAKLLLMALDALVPIISKAI